MQKTIHKRAVCDEIQKYLFTDDILVLHGARQVGKTHILFWLRDRLLEQGKTVHYLDLEDSRLRSVLDAGVPEFFQYLKELGLNPEKFSGTGEDRLFVFIDEIQYLKDPSSFLKLMADHHKPVKLVVSGSSSFDIRSKFSDSLAGRTVDFEIYTLSFREYLMFRQAGLIPDEAATQKTMDDLRAHFRQFVIYGGYPKIALTDEKAMKERYIQQIIDTYVRKDVRDLANVRDIDKFNKLLEMLAAQSGSLVNISELANTCDLAKQTVEEYLTILEQTYVIKRLRPYHKNIRSELSKTPKVFFYDSGLMQMLWLKALPQEILGTVFETAVFAEFVKTRGSKDLFFWRTQGKQEIDFILRKPDGLVPYEVKLRFEQWNRSSMKYFCDRYGIEECYCVGLEGDVSARERIFPWQI